MGNFLCKIWNFFANLLSGILNFIFDLIRVIADIVVGFVEDLVNAVFGSSPLLWLVGAGLLAYLIFSKDKKEDGNVIDLSGVSRRKN